MWLARTGICISRVCGLKKPHMWNFCRQNMVRRSQGELSKTSYHAEVAQSKSLVITHIRLASEHTISDFWHTLSENTILWVCPHCTRPAPVQLRCAMCVKCTAVFQIACLFFLLWLVNSRLSRSAMHDQPINQSKWNTVGTASITEVIPLPAPLHSQSGTSNIYTRPH